MSEKNIALPISTRRCHSEESAVSSQDSHGRREEVIELKNKLQFIVLGRNHSQRQVGFYEGKIKKYELQGFASMLQSAQESLKHQTEQFKFYSDRMLDMEKRIRWLTEKYPAAFEKKQNYATMKLKNHFEEDEDVPSKKEGQVMQPDAPCSNLADPLEDYYAKKKVVAALTIELHKLTPHRIWAQARAEQHEQHIKKYELKWSVMVWKERQMLEHETQMLEFYNQQINEIGKKIASMPIVHPAALENTEHEAVVTADEPTSQESDSPLKSSVLRSQEHAYQYPTMSPPFPEKQEIIDLMSELSELAAKRDLARTHVDESRAKFNEEEAQKSTEEETLLSANSKCEQEMQIYEDCNREIIEAEKKIMQLLKAPTVGQQHVKSEQAVVKKAEDASNN